MKKTLHVFIVAILAGNLFATSNWDQYWSKIENFQYEYFEKEYIDCNDGLKEYALYYTGEQKPQLARKAAEKISTVLESMELNPKDTAEYNYILAEIYFNLIVDAKSWMDFADLYETSVENILRYDNQNIRYQLTSAKGMLKLPTPRGNAELGEENLSDLLVNNPDNTLVVYSDANRNFQNGNIETAEEGFKKVITLNPNHKLAISRLNSIELNKKNLTIRNIKINNDLKTSQKRINKKLHKYIGEKLNFNIQNEMTKEISKISSIGGVTINGIQINDENVDLELNINENNFRAIGLLVGAPIGIDYSNEVVPNGMAAFLYIDSNLLGTGIRLNMTTAAIFNKIDIMVPGLINDGIIDLKLSLESMFINADKKIIENGKQVKVGKSSFHNIKFGLGREFDFGVSAFINYKAKFEPQEKLDSVIEKDDSIFHEFNGEFILNLAGNTMSGLQTLEGVNFSFIPQLIYKPNYKEWGKKGELFKHDNNYSLQFATQLGFYTNIGKSNNIGIKLTHLASINPYQSERFRIGHGGTPFDKYILSGFLPSEIVTDNALLSNFKYTFIQRPNKLNLYGKYDLLYDSDRSELYHGSAIGLNAVIPWDIDMTAEFGVGINADREELPGLVISVTFMKLYPL